MLGFYYLMNVYMGFPRIPQEKPALFVGKWVYFVGAPTIEFLVSI